MTIETHPETGADTTDIELSIVMPAYHCADTIAADIRRLEETVSSLVSTYEIIVVVDGDEETFAAAAAAAAHRDAAAARHLRVAAQRPPAVAQQPGGVASVLPLSPERAAPPPVAVAIARRDASYDADAEELSEAAIDAVIHGSGERDPLGESER